MNEFLGGPEFYGPVASDEYFDCLQSGLQEPDLQLLYAEDNNQLKANICFNIFNRSLERNSLDPGRSFDCQSDIECKTWPPYGNLQHYQD